MSKALELILRRDIATIGQTAQSEPDDPAATEREVNNRAYIQMKAELAHKAEETFAVIALGKLQGYAPKLEEAYELLAARAPDAKHAIIKKIGEKVETEAVWEAIGERI